MSKRSWDFIRRGVNGALVLALLFGAPPESLRAAGDDRRSLECAKVIDQAGVFDFQQFRLDFQDFQFAKAMESLSQRQMRHISRKLAQAAKQELTNQGLEELTLDVYRIVYPPKTLWRLYRETKSMREAYDLKDDELIREKLQVMLLKDLMRDALQMAIREPTTVERLKLALKKHASKLDTVLALGIWTSSLTLLPPYLPQLYRIENFKLSEHVKRVAREEGVDQAVDEAKEELYSSFRRAHAYSLSRAVYLTVVSVFLAAGIYSATMAGYHQYVQQQGLAQVQAYDRMVQDHLQFGAMTPEEQGVADFNRFVKFLEEHGQKVDVDSPEMQAEKQKRIDYFVSRSKENPDSARAPANSSNDPVSP